MRPITFSPFSLVVLVVAFFAFSAFAAPAVGVFSFEDGATTDPVEVWFSPGSVTNVAGGHEGARAVAATGNVRVKFIPAAEQTRVVYWLKTNVQTHIDGNLQYFNGAWQLLGETPLDLAADALWREQTIALSKPAGTVYVFTNLWLPAGVTATFDDVTACAANPAGAVEGFETASATPWSVWYGVSSVQNTNAVSHAGARSVAISGTVKFGVAPFVTQAAFWHRRASGRRT